MDPHPVKSTMPFDIHAHEEALLRVGLEREPNDQESLLDSTRNAILAIQIFCAGWLEPLVWELSIACQDSELLHIEQRCQPPRPDWVLRRARIPSGVQARLLHVAPVLRTLPAFSPEDMHAWVTEALNQECPGAPRFVPAWSRLWSRAMQAALPDPQRFAGRDSMQIDCYAGPTSIPLECRDDKVYVSGPLESHVFGPPAALTLGNDDGFLTIDFEVYWDLWITEPAGRAQVEAAVDRVLALGRGWQRAER